MHYVQADHIHSNIVLWHISAGPYTGEIVGIPYSAVFSKFFKGGGVKLRFQELREGGHMMLTYDLPNTQGEGEITYI